MKLNTTFRCGTIALIGRPNVGKSTLLNILVGRKISITSCKMQTTRDQILGIHTTNNAQFIFIDTPGFQKKYVHSINKMMNNILLETIIHADVICFIIEAGCWNQLDQQILDLLSTNYPVILFLNKMDIFYQKKTNQNHKDILLSFVKQISEKFSFAEIVPLLSQYKNDSTYLYHCFEQYLPIKKAIYCNNTYTNQDNKFRLSEIIREKIFRYTGDEVPYTTDIAINQFHQDRKLIHVAATIFVKQKNHKTIILGKQGEKIKHISIKARQDIEKIFNKKVYLEIWIKTKNAN